ncbi:MAG TPA: hypothetical protein VHE32_04955 [Rhodanobacteraceae bacterium]|jgi:hypothetical protein|nr:hypothetical protein [Rhodanobacteraceae bacterium]
MLTVSFLETGGFAVGTLHCRDPETGTDRFVYSTSGSIAEAEQRCTVAASRLPATYVIADPRLKPAYWAGRRDPRFIVSRNPDGSAFDGDSTTCAEPRLLQCALENGWIVLGMSIGWHGQQPNPLPDFPRDPTGRYMRRCPSCQANVGALMQSINISHQYNDSLHEMSTSKRRPAQA